MSSNPRGDHLPPVLWGVVVDYVCGPRLFWMWRYRACVERVFDQYRAAEGETVRLYYRRTGIWGPGLPDEGAGESYCDGWEPSHAKGALGWPLRMQHPLANWIYVFLEAYFPYHDYEEGIGSFSSYFPYRDYEGEISSFCSRVVWDYMDQGCNPYMPFELSDDRFHLLEIQRRLAGRPTIDDASPNRRVMSVRSPD